MYTCMGIIRPENESNATQEKMNLHHQQSATIQLKYHLRHRLIERASESVKFIMFFCLHIGWMAGEWRVAKPVKLNERTQCRSIIRGLLYYLYIHTRVIKTRQHKTFRE